MRKYTHFLQIDRDDKNETIEELTKRVEGNKTKHTGGIFDRLSQ